MLLLPAALIGFPTETPGLGPVAAVVVLGIVGTGIAFVMLYELIATVGPARTWIVTYLAPAFAVVYGVTLLDEEVTVATLGGLALILFGSYLAAEGRNPLRRRNVAAELGPCPRSGAGRYRSASSSPPSASRVARTRAGRSREPTRTVPGGG